MNNITLIKPDWEKFESFLDFISDLIKEINESHKSAAISVAVFCHDVKACHDLRKNRKSLGKFIKSITKDFPNFSEKKQVALELLLYNTLNDLKKIIPTIESELKDNTIFIGFRLFLIRELKRTLHIFSRAQHKMSQQIYKDNSEEILGNPELYNKLVNTWADVDDY